MITSRTGRFYVGRVAVEWGGMTGISPPTPQPSDHAPIFVRIRSKGRCPKKEKSFDKSLLEIAEHKQNMLEAWQEAISTNHEGSWNSEIARALRVAKESNSTKSREKKRNGK